MIRNQNIRRNRQPNRHQQNQITVQRLEVILLFLKKRFSHYPLENIIHSLTQKAQNQIYERTQPPKTGTYHWGEDNLIQDHDEYQTFPQPAHQSRRQKYTKYTCYPKTYHQIYPVSVNAQQHMKKRQQIKLVAKIFCETGYNFKLIKYFFPYLTQQQYNSYLLTIVGQVINSVHDFLRFQCNIAVQYISSDQKRSLRSQLIKLRDWLPKKSPACFETFLKFIQRSYLSSPEVNYAEAIALYKMFLQVIRSPFVNIEEIDPNDGQVVPPPAIQPGGARTVPLKSYSRQQQQQIIQYFIKFKNIRKVSEQMQCIRGNSKKWSENSIIEVIKWVIKKALKKVIMCKAKYLNDAAQIKFKDDSTFANSIYQSRTLKQSMLTLLKLYIANRMTATGLKNIITQLNKYFRIRNENNNEDNLQLQQDEISIIPKIEFESKIENRNRGSKSIIIDLQQNEIKIQGQQNIQNIQNIQGQKLSQQTCEPKQQYQYDANLYQQQIQINQ